MQLKRPDQFIHLTLGTLFAQEVTCLQWSDSFTLHMWCCLGQWCPGDRHMVHLNKYDVLYVYVTVYGRLSVPMVPPSSVLSCLLSVTWLFVG